MTVRTLQDEQAAAAPMRRRASSRRSFRCRPGTRRAGVPRRMHDSNTIAACAVCVRVPSSAARPAFRDDAVQCREFPLSIYVVTDIEYATLEILQPGEARLGVGGSPGRGRA